MRQIEVWRKHASTYQYEKVYSNSEMIRKDMKLRRMVAVTRCKFMTCTTGNDGSDRFIMSTKKYMKISTNDNKNDDFYDIVQDCIDCMKRSN